MLNKLIKSKFIVVVIALLLLVLTVIDGRGVFPAFAETSSYTSVLNDLKKDSTFKTSDYPDNAKDYSIKVIQIAEGEHGELFLYTYLPCQKTKYLVATDINMSLSETADGTKLYGLKPLSCSGVFAKYLVKDITVSSSAIRYYNISSIYRAWDKDIDEGTGNNNTKNSVSFEVGKCFTATTENGIVKYQCKETETIVVTDKYVDYLQYKNGWLTYAGWTDSHYIAFTTDKPIDKLVEADVNFATQLVRLKYNLFTNDYREVYAWEPEEETVTLNYEHSFGGNSASGLFSKKYQWQCVQSVSEFRSSVKSDGLTLSSETESNLKNKQWVLRFYESEYDYFESTNDTYKTRVSDVTILRLKFETDGKTYNLGVVDNKQSGDEKPGNTQIVVGGDNENSSNWFVKFVNYIWNCGEKLFAGTASGWETFVAIVAIIVAIVVAMVVIALTVVFLKWFWRTVRK